MEANDLMYAAGALAAVLFLALLGVLAAAFLFTLGSPLVLIGSLLAMGALGLVALFGVLMAFISLWYVVYALLKNMGRKEEKPAKGNYTLDRMRKS